MSPKDLQFFNKPGTNFAWDDKMFQWSPGKNIILDFNRQTEFLYALSIGSSAIPDKAYPRIEAIIREDIKENPKQNHPNSPRLLGRDIRVWCKIDQIVKEEIAFLSKNDNLDSR